MAASSRRGRDRGGDNGRLLQIDANEVGHDPSWSVPALDPMTQDAFGHALLARAEGLAGVAVVERDDGFIEADRSDYIAPMSNDDELWKWMLPRLGQRIVDVGAGASGLSRGQPSSRQTGRSCPPPDPIRGGGNAVVQLVWASPDELQETAKAFGWIVMGVEEAGAFYAAELRSDQATESTNRKRIVIG